MRTWAPPSAQPVRQVQFLGTPPPTEETTMYQKVARVVTEVREILSGVQCNKCGRSTEFGKEGRGGCDNGAQEFHDFEAHGSYSSKFPYDMTTVKWVLCADCLKALVETFEVPPETSGYGELFPTIQATDTTDGAQVEVHLGLAYPQGQVPEEPAMLSYEVVAEIDQFEWPLLGVYRHYKGGIYTTVGSCLRASTKEPLVLYRELHGESKYWVRPLAEWSADVSGPHDNREVLRFTEVSFLGQEP